MANVKFKRLLSSELVSEAIEDGKTIWIKNGNNELYLDVGTVRKKMIPSDTALSTTSTNPIQNQALTNSIINTLSEAIAITADNIPCGTKPVKELITNLNAIDARVDANELGSSVTITSYNTEGNKYTFPSDGYIEFTNANNTVGAYVSAVLYDANNVKIGSSIHSASANNYANGMLYVKKGMKVFFSSATSAFFRPIS